MLSEAPPNLLALTSIGFAVVGFPLLNVVLCGGWIFAVIGLVLAGAGMVTGVLGIRHARTHGVGGAYARYGLGICSVQSFLHTTVSLVAFALLASGLSR